MEREVFSSSKESLVPTLFLTVTLVVLCRCCCCYSGILISKFLELKTKFLCEFLEIASRLRKDSSEENTHVMNDENKPAEQVCKPQDQNVHCNHKGTYDECWDENLCCVSHCKTGKWYLQVEAPEPAADEITPRLVMASIRPPYTMLFMISTLRPSTTGVSNGSVRVSSSGELTGTGAISSLELAGPVITPLSPVSIKSKQKRKVNSLISKTKKTVSFDVLEIEATKIIA